MEGTAKRVRQAFYKQDGSVIAMGGKTGTGDQRFDVYGAGHRLIESRYVNRSATFVFNIGERFFGSMTAYVHGAQAEHYDFTSALPVQLLMKLAPSLMPMIERQDTVTIPGLHVERAAPAAAGPADAVARDTEQAVPADAVSVDTVVGPDAATVEPKAAAEPVAKPAEKPADKPAAKPADKPAVKPADKPAVKPAGDAPHAKAADHPKAAGEGAARKAASDDRAAAKPAAHKPEADGQPKPAQKPPAKPAAKPADPDAPRAERTARPKPAAVEEVLQ